MDSLSLFQSMQGNVNPIEAYAAGSRIANQMLQVQAQQGQQVFENLFRSAQQNQQRQQFEQTMAMRERQFQDESARGWFNAETQRSFSQDRLAQSGQPVPSFDPYVTQVDGERLLVTPGARGQRQFSRIPEGGQASQPKPTARFMPGINPAGSAVEIIGAQEAIIPQGQIAPAQQQPMPSSAQPPMPAGILNTPNPPIDTGSSGQFAAPPTDMSVSEYPFDNQGTYREDWVSGAAIPSAQEAIMPQVAQPPMSQMETMLPAPAPATVPASTITQPPMMMESARNRDYPAYVDQMMPALRRGEEVARALGSGEFGEVYRFKDGEIQVRTMKATGEPTTEWTPFDKPGSVRVNFNDPESIQRAFTTVDLISQAAGTDYQATFSKDGEMSIAPKTGDRKTRDMATVQTPGQFIEAIGDTTTREQASKLLVAMADPFAGRDRAGIVSEISIQQNIPEDQVTPQMVETAKNQRRLESARSLTNLASSFVGSVPWGDEYDALRLAGGVDVRRPTPPSAANPNGTPATITELPKTPEDLERDQAKQKKVDEVMNGWRDIQSSFEERILQKGGYTEEQLDGVASGIYQDPSRTGYRVDLMPEKSYADRLLVKLGLMSNTYPEKRPGATVFTNLRPSEVALAWAKDRLSRKGILNQEGRMVAPSTAPVSEPVKNLLDKYAPQGQTGQ